MNFVVNVGESAYRQWKKLKGENMPECEPKQDHVRKIIKYNILV